jgi:hypothetical protein
MINTGVSFHHLSRYEGRRKYQQVDLGLLISSEDFFEKGNQILEIIPTEKEM